MSDPKFSGILLTTEKEALSVAPGGTQELPVIIKKNSASPEQVRLMVEGVPLPWISTERPVVLVQPGEEVCVTLVIHPPEPPSANAGRYQMRIIVTSTLDPVRRAETLVTLTVAGFEVPGRVGVLLNGLQYAVTPGETLAVPVVISNQGLGTSPKDYPVDLGDVDPRLRPAKRASGARPCHPLCQEDGGKRTFCGAPGRRPDRF